METVEDVTVWHRDGHVMFLQLNRTEVVVWTVNCPGNDDRACQVGRFPCLVQHFLDRFGLECNVGVCDVHREMEIAWSLQGDPLDPEACQVWVIPIADEAFAAWLATQNVEPESE